MNVSFRNFFIIFVFITLIIGGLGVSPAYAASSMEIVPLSLPDGWRSGNLNSIWGSSASDIYAVGYGNNGSAIVPLVYRNVGIGWSASSLSLPAGQTAGYLFAIWGFSTNDVYAAGYSSSGNTALPMLYHKDATSWTATNLSLPAGLTSGYLYSVWGSSASDIYAAGYGYNGSAALPLMYHNDGSGWSASSLSLPVGWTSVSFKALWGSGPNDVYAIGYGYNGTALLPILYHKDDVGWSASNLAISLGSGYLYSVWGSSASDAYVAGYGYSSNATVPLLYHKEGTNWTATNPALPAGWDRGYLYSIWGSSASDVYVVGSGNNGSNLRPLLYHKDATNWSEASPSLPTGWIFGYLHGVWGSSATDVYAVGTGNNGTMNLPMLYHSGQGAQDLLAPGDVTNFTASSGQAKGSVSLSWTAPADDYNDPNSGPVASYLVKYSTSSFSSWSDGIPVTTGLPNPAPFGASQTMTISGLNPGTLYYFAIRAQDEQYNLSANYVVTSVVVKIPPVGAGIYDDRYPAWSYTGNWKQLNTVGPYQGTFTYSDTTNNSASLTFEGVKFTLYYLQYTNRGVMNIFIDDFATPVATLNMNGSQVWQQTWTSPTLSAGVHTLKLVHVSGTYVDVDAIQIYSPVGAGIYDDRYPAWTYTGSWGQMNIAGPYQGTFTYSDTTNNSASLTFNGSQFTLYYLQYTNRGVMNIFIDDFATPVATLNMNGPLVWQQTWTSPTLSAGVHTLKLVHVSGTYVDVDAIQISGPAPAGTYDDRYPAWSYTGNWKQLNTVGPYQGTFTYSETINDNASFTFEGVKFTLYYLQYTNRGVMDIYIDDFVTPVATLNMNGPLVWQQTWTSPSLSPGVHTVRFVFANGGTYVDVDAIQIQ